MNWNADASYEWNINRLGASVDREVGAVVLTTGITYTTSIADEVILVSGAIAPIYINLTTAGATNGKLYTVKDVGTATAGVGGIRISGYPGSIDGSPAGLVMTTGYTNGVTAAATKTYNKVTVVYNDGEFWSV